jgi:hypothetical protein
MITLDTFTFPDGVGWIDRRAHSVIVGSRSVSITGAIVFETGALQAGRPITIATMSLGGGYAGLFTKDKADEIAALHGVEAVRTITIGQESFTVRFDRDAPNGGLTVNELVPISAEFQFEEFVYSVTCNLVTA